MDKRKLAAQIPLFLAAFFIAGVIWLMAKQGDLTTQRLVIPINVENIPENLELSISPRQVAVIVKFPQSQRTGIVAQNFEVQLDAGDFLGEDPRAQAGIDDPITHQVTLSLDDVISHDLPQSVRVDAFGSNGEIQINAKLRALAVPVKVATQGKLPSEFEFREPIRAEPSEVLVSASAKALQNLSESNFRLTTSAVRLRGKSQDFIEFVELKVPEHLTLVHDEDQNIEVSVLIREKEVQRIIGEVPVEIYVLSEKLRARINPTKVEVRVKGGISAVEALNEDSFLFSSKDFLSEEEGLNKRIELEVTLNEDVPVDIRQRIQIEGILPTMVDVEFVKVKRAR